MLSAPPLPLVPDGHDHPGLDPAVLEESLAGAAEAGFKTPAREVDVEPAVRILAAAQAECAQCVDVFAAWMAEHADPLLVVHVSSPLALAAGQVVDSLSAVLRGSWREHVRVVLEHGFGADVAAVVVCVAADSDLVAAVEAYEALPLARREVFIKAAVLGVVNPPVSPEGMTVLVTDR